MVRGRGHAPPSTSEIVYAFPPDFLGGLRGGFQGAHVRELGRHVVDVHVCYDAVRDVGAGGGVFGDF